MKTFATRFLGVALLLATNVAGADAASGEDDLTKLIADLDRETTALSTDDCQNACRALASIRRAAERICALDAGQHCTDARRKADAASRRVRAACPDCAIAEMTPRAPAADSPSATGTAEPARVEKRGGCAGCAETPAAPASPLVFVSVASAIAALLRRRRSR